MVVSEAPIATRVGVEVLARGGNAVDAAVAVAFALAVVYPQAGNLGGGGFAVVREPGGAAAALDFRETAPAAARRDMYLDARGAPTEASRVGHLAAAVPGSVAGLVALHARFGARPWRELLAPAIALARDGFPVDDAFAKSVAAEAAMLGRFPASAALFLPGGKPLAAGATFRDPDLARVLERVAASGARGFYEGETAAAVAAEMKRGGGIVTRADLAAYRAVWREPVAFDYRGVHLVSMPPPSSGGVTLAMLAHQLARFDLAGAGWHSPEHLHLLAEAMRRAFAVRNARLGDPDAVAVPTAELASDAFGAKLAATIGARATPSSEVDGAAAEAPDGPNTTHLDVIDASGMAVALTTTINALYGSGVTVAGAGFLLNDEMDDFAVKPGTPNLYGLVQGEVNAIAPGKRPLSSMSPTVVADARGDVLMVAGARGGSRIITATWQVLSNVIDFGMPVGAAVAAPRVHQQHLPDELWLEARGFAPGDRAALVALGYRLVDKETLGNAPALVRTPGGWAGAFDPRRGGLAAGPP